MKNFLLKLNIGTVFLAIISVFALAFVPILNSTQSHASQQTTSVGLSIDTVLSLSVANCSGLPDANSYSLTFNTMPTPTGTFASNCQTLSINTNAPGYSLLTKASSSNLEYLNPTTVSPTPSITPIISSLSTNPTAITPNHWGFAAKGNNITLNPNTTTYPGLNFTQTYTANNKDNTYSTLPTTDTQLYNTTQIPGKTDQATFWYATNVDTSQLAGLYSTTVTYTVIGEVVPEPVFPTCASGNESKNKCAVDLNSGLTPVAYDSNGNTIKADENAANGAWYDYDNKQWANAIVLNGTDTYTVGDIIPEANIKAYFVYVPRYKYEVQRYNYSDAAISTPQAFDIEFQKATDAKETPSQTGDWSTHPAFTFGSTELNGIWVGKFETSYGQDNVSATTTSEVALSHGVYIKPNEYSLRRMKVKNMSDTAQALKGSSYYNLTDSDSRMMKNSEWGAVTYLSHSNYGTCTSGTCTEVYINNCLTYKTGIAGDTPDASDSSTTCTTAANQWDGTTGVKASTTQNQYGIYDMSGGTNEYVMGVLGTTTSSSGFATNLTDIASKYYDTYSTSIFTGTNTTNMSLCTYTQCGGHALFETNVSGTTNWYTDYGTFVSSIYPWFFRGGYYYDGALAGLFNSNYRNGVANINYGFRVALSKP